MKQSIRNSILIVLTCILVGCAQSTPEPRVHEDEVTLGDGEWALPGALTVPNGSRQFPAVVHVHGSGPNDRSKSSVQGPTDPKELETFLDALFIRQLEENHVAGLAVALVKDGQVYFQKGYGYADLEKQTPVDPAATIFRIGSVTKLFTWTAVMQLVEQGRLDLDADINTYLDFKIPDTYPEPITLRHLMTHTAGFEDRAFEIWAAGYDQIQPLGQFLANHIPARVRPAGQAAVYSNYGADLAGYIIERVSGMPFAEYLEQNIFNPLQMDDTTARIPLPPKLATQLSSGYRNLPDTLQPGVFNRIPNTQPDCCISSTAADMVRFMTAHLNGGQLPGGQGTILEASTEREMQSSQWAPDDGLTGFTYGFMEQVFNGQRILFHGGDIAQFHSLLALIPGQDIGLFISYNTEAAAGLPDLTLLALLEHYYPQDKAAAQPPQDFEAQANRFAGYYRPARGAYTTLEKVDVLGKWIEVKPSNDGALLVGTPFSPQKTRLEAVGPGLFREPTYGVLVSFRVDQHQGLTYLFDTSQPGFPYEKLPWFANPYLHYGLLGVSFALFLSVILALPAGVLVRRFNKRKPQIQPPLSRAFRWLAFLVAVLNLLALANFLVMLTGGSLLQSIAYGQVSTINIILAAWLAAALLTLPLLVFTGLAWKNRYWGTASRIHFTLVAVAALAFTWFLSCWNLLGFRY